MAFVRTRGLGDHYIQVPRRGRARHAALGDEPAPMTQTEWQMRLLAAQEKTVEEAARFREQDRLTRNMQLVATVSIPLFAAIWRQILKHD